jgi:hypothetical protein
MRRSAGLLSGLAALLLAGCVSADPGIVARAVGATLTAVPTQTPVVVVVTVLSAATPAPGVPTATLAPTVTAPPTEPALTLTPSPTLPTAAAFIPDEAPAFADDFSAPGLFTLDEDDILRMALVDGRLEFAIRRPDQFRFVFTSTRRARDFVAVVTGAAPACLFRDRYGLLFRVEDASNYYQLEVDCDGRYRLSRVEAGALTALQDWTADGAIRAGSGAANTLGVRAQAGRLEAFVNGAPVHAATDAAFAEGGFGVVVGAGPAAGFTATFDDLTVWELR